MTSTLLEEEFQKQDWDHDVRGTNSAEEGFSNKFTSNASKERCKSGRPCRQLVYCPRLRRDLLRCSRTEARRGPSRSSSPPSYGRGRGEHGHRASKWSRA